MTQTSLNGRGRQQKRSDDSPWLDAREGADYASDGYRNFLEKLKNGDIRCVRDGRKFKTTKEWIDDYFFGLEDIGVLERK